MAKLVKKEVGQRLRKFALLKYGKIKPLSEALGIAYHSFHSVYIKGKSLPGAEILSRLSNLGCDIDWLLHGEKDVANKLIINKEQIPYILHSEDVEYLKILNKEGISSPEELKKLLKKYKKIKNIILE